jgi:Tat protein translocase TatB subunit
MFGIGPTELVVVAVLFLIIFGPSKMPQMARDIGKFVGQARGAIDEFKDELTAEDTDSSDRPARNREEGSRKRQDSQNRASDSRHENEDRNGEEPPEESSGSSGSSRRESAEYDL